MARHSLTSINLTQNEIQNARVQNLATAPATPVEGQIYYDTATDAMFFWNGASWRSMDAAAAGVAASTWNANTIVKADTNDNPVALTVAEQTLVGRITSGVITDLSISQVKTLLSLTDNEVKALVGAMVTGNTETGVAVTYQAGDHTLDFVVEPINTLPTPTGDLAMATFKITGLGTPTAATDAATKGYVDSAINGLSWKDQVKAATAVAGTLATSFENADVIDGVTLSTNDRILIKNQAAPAENGIYVVQATGAPVRATDADTEADLLSAAVFVEQGTANADTAWIMTTNAPITVDTTGLVWIQFGAGATYTAGNGLTLTGNEFDVNVDDSTIEINADTLRVKDAGITDAKLFESYSKQYEATVGDGVATTYALNHALGSKDIIVDVYRVASPFDTVECDVTRSNTNEVTVGFTVAPTASEFRVVVQGR